MSQASSSLDEARTYDSAIAEVRRFLRNGSLRLIARVNTPWTILGLEAWLDRNWSGGDGVVLLMPNAIGEQKRWPTEQLAFLSRFPGIRAIRVSPFTDSSYRKQNVRRVLALGDVRAWLPSAAASTSQLNILAPRTRDITVLVDVGLRRVFQRFHVVFQLIDEGFGNIPLDDIALTETDDIRTRLKNGERLKAAVMRASQLARARIERVIRRRTSDEQHFLVYRKVPRGPVQVNATLAGSYRKVLDRYPGTVAFQRRSGRPIAVVLTDHLSELGIMDPDRERALWREVIARVGRAGFDVVLKPHPREATDKYEALKAALPDVAIQTLPSGEAAEKLYQNLQAGDVLLGITNNALLTGHVLYELPVYTVDTLAKEYGAAEWFIDAVARQTPVFVRGARSIRELGG